MKKLGAKRVNKLSEGKRILSAEKMLVCLFVRINEIMFFRIRLLLPIYADLLLTPVFLEYRLISELATVGAKHDMSILFGFFSKTTGPRGNINIVH